MAQADIIVEIAFNLDDPEKTTIKTNAKKEALEEILMAWLYCQFGKGADNREANIKTEYNIRIQLDLSNDTFNTVSDTGNKSLTCGLVMDVLRRLPQIPVVGLAEGVPRQIEAQEI